jgi:hypothetical protein
MADLKISQLTASSTPLAGTEVLPIVQSSTTKQVSVANLTAGRAVNAGSLGVTGNLTAGTATLNNGATYTVVFNSSGQITTTAERALRMSDTANGGSAWLAGVNSGSWFLSVSGGANALILDNSGNVTIAGATATKASGTTWANPSDVRLKDNIEDYTKGLTELLQIRPRTWVYNGKGDTCKDTPGIGVIADEIAQVLPETVSEYMAKLEFEDVEKTNIKKFDASEIIWLLVNSVKEQQAMIDSLKTRLDAANF